MYREPRSLSLPRRLTSWLGSLQQSARSGADRQADAESLALAHAASTLDVSEFDVFCLAHRSWYGRTGSLAHLEREFGRYLNRRVSLPFYVRRFFDRIAVLEA